MSKRELVSRFLKQPVETFDMVNYSVRFQNEVNAFSAKCPTFENRFLLHEHIAGQIGDAPVDYLEFGVWQGATILKWLGMNRHPDSRFVGFDSFEGLPEDWVPGQPKGTFSTGGAQPRVDDQRGSFVKGWFQNTLYGFLEDFRPRGQLVIHVDCDLYSSTLFVLSALDRHLTPGTFIIFDDFSSMTHEFAAWLDYRRSFSRNWEPVAITNQGLQAAVRLQP